MDRLPGTPQQRDRARSAPLALLLAVWGLMLGPLGHAVIAHGEPILHSGSDEGWIGHRPATPDTSPAPERPRGHAHAPGVPDHFRLALLASEPPGLPDLVLVRGRSPSPLLRVAPTLARRWAQEQPQGP
jgi:hypothetical protein